jgi:hypothetical protein
MSGEIKSKMRVSDEYLQMTLQQLEREKPLDSQLISTTFYQMLCNEIVERRAEAPPAEAHKYTLTGWTKVIHSPFELHPREVFEPQAQSPGDGWTPVYRRTAVTKTEKPDCPHCDGFLAGGIVRHDPRCQTVTKDTAP